MDLLTTWTPAPDPGRTESALAPGQAGENAIQHPGWCKAHDGLMAQLIAALDAAKPEGDARVTPFTFTVTRTSDLTAASAVNYTVLGCRPRGLRKRRLNSA